MVKPQFVARAVDLTCIASMKYIILMWRIGALLLVTLWLFGLSWSDLQQPLLGLSRDRCCGRACVLQGGRALLPEDGNRSSSHIHFFDAPHD